MKRLFIILSAAAGFVGLSAPPVATISLDAATTYQTITTGWMAAAQTGELKETIPRGEAPLWASYSDGLLNDAVNNLGLTCLSMGVRSGQESSTDRWAQYMAGTGPNVDFDVINDNSNPTSANASGFHWGFTDFRAARTVAKFRAAMIASGQTPCVKAGYVDFSPSTTTGFKHSTDAAEYGEFFLQFFDHMQATFGWVPTELDIVTEPTNGSNWWTPTALGNAVTAVKARLAAAGYTPRIIAPSYVGIESFYITNISTLLGMPGVAAKIDDVGYHLYSGRDDTQRAALRAAAAAAGKQTNMTELIGGDQATIMADLTVANASGWMANSLAFPDASDDGGNYYTLNGTTGAYALASRARYLRHFFRYIRPGAVRIGAASAQGALTPVAFVNTGGRSVVVVNATSAQAFTVGPLPAGTYGIRYTTATATHVNAGDQTIGAGGTIATSIPDAGTITIFDTGASTPAPPGAFGKSGPAIGATGQSTSLTLSWGASTGATSYEYCYDTTNDGACSVWTSTGTSTNAAISGLAANTAYYWQARATNASGTTYADAAAFAGFTTQALSTALVAAGKTLTVTTANAIATFTGPDLTGFVNVLTNETYLRNPSAGDLASINTMTLTGQPLQTSDWTIAPAPGTGQPVATLTAHDSARLLTLTVLTDPASQEIVLNLTATSSNAGLRDASWSIAGLDLSGGRLVVPAYSGVVFDAAHPGVGTLLEYPNTWHAQMAAYEAAAGSLVLYSTDQQLLFKRLNTSTRGGTTLDVAVATEAIAPFPSATIVPAVEWRLKAFAGDWRTAAGAYRNWLGANRPAASNAAHAWTTNIRAVVRTPPDQSLLAALAAKVVPSQALLYVFDWRQNAYDAGYPDYTPRAGVANFVDAAHALGFKVMLHFDLIGVSPADPAYVALQAYQLRDPETLAPMGWKWNAPPSTINRFAIIDPAAPAFRSLWINRAGAAIAAVNPDALHLDLSGPMYNDGNGPIGGLTYPAGSAQFHREIEAAFPWLALGGEGENDITYRYHAFAQAWYPAGPLPEVATGHPIATFLFSQHVQYYGHLSQASARDPAFQDDLIQLSRRAILPLLPVAAASDLDSSNAENARLLGIISSWQTHAFQPAWVADWTGALVRYLGAGGSAAELTESATALTLKAAGATLFQLVHGANQLATSLFAPSWPAFDGTTLYGLDPDRQYFLDPLARPAGTHITSVPAGVRLGSGTLVGAGFAHIELAGQAPVSMNMGNLVDARTGVNFGDQDWPLAGGAVVVPGSITSGGVTRSGLFLHPPYLETIGGETFVEHTVTIPVNGVLRFSVGVDDFATCSDGVTFRVTAAGSEVWRQSVTSSGWRDGVVNLAAMAGATIPIRFISNPGPYGNPSCDWSLWNQITIESAAAAAQINVPIALASGSTLSGFDGDGSLSLTPPLSAIVQNVRLPGQFTVFTQPGAAVTAGADLLTLPYELWRAGHADLAQPGAASGAGGVGAMTSGGVTKTRAIRADPPNGRTILSWTLALPAVGPLQLVWAAGFVDGSASDDGVDFDVRINGTSYWRLTSQATAWAAGNLDLSRWKGQNVLVELVTDSRANYYDDWVAWADVVLAPAVASCAATPGAVTPAEAAGGSFSLAVTGVATCPWLSTSDAPWLTVTSSSGSGNGTVNYVVAPNAGAPRAATLSVAGQPVMIAQAGVGGACAYTLSASGSGVLSAGGTGGSVVVTTGSSCTWTATPGQEWIHTTSSGTGSGTVAYTIDANPAAARAGNIVVGGQTFVVTQAAAGCSYALGASSSGLLPATAGAGNVAVTTPSWCTWTATPDQTWIHSTSSGTGNGTVTYTVDANPAGARAGNIAVGGQTFVVTQAAAGCSYALGAGGSGLMAATAGAGNVAVTTGSWCTWTATPDQTWIHSTSNGTGSGTVSYAVDANAGGARSGNITIGGQVFAVAQAAASCSYTLGAPGSGLLPATAGAGNVAVTTGSWCTWTATPDQSWMHTTSGSTGSGIVSFTIDANEGGTRSGAIAIAGQTFVVTQTAAGCGYAISTASSGLHPAAASAGSVIVTTGNWCVWSATPDQTWIHTTSGGTGDGVVNYSLDENAGAARSGTLTIGGETFTIAQAAASCSYALSASSGGTLAAVAGGGSVAVTTGSWCAWSATADAPWIHVPGGGAGSDMIAYTVDANAGGSRAGTITIAGQVFAVAQAAAPCSYVLGAPASGLLAAAAGGGSIAVTAGSWCTWTSTPDEVWIHTASGGTGDGSATFSVDANPGAARSGSIDIAGQIFVVAQAAAACGYSLGASGAAVAATAGGGIVPVTTGAWCAWNATSGDAWIHTTSAGTGNGDLIYTVDANPGMTRNGAITVGGQTFLVAQTAAACSYTLGASGSGTLPDTAGGGSVSVTAGSWCSWAAMPDQAWIHTTSSGVGDGSVVFAVDANPGATRSGTLEIAGQTFVVTQTAAGCSYALGGPASVLLPPNASNGTVSVLTSSWCVWIATPDQEWIQSSSSGTGNGTVLFAVEANPGAARVGTITIGGQTFTIAQTVAPCAYALGMSSSGPLAAGPSGGGFAVSTGSWCDWAAEANQPWITSSSSGVGSGFVSFSVAANSGAARTGVITVAGQTFLISQAAAACSYSLSAADSGTLAAVAGGGSVAVTTGNWCTWHATPDQSWIQTTNSGAGDGTVTFTVEANPGAPRIGTITVAGEIFAVSQSAAACSYVLSAAGSGTLLAGAGGGNVTVTTGSWCGWSAVPDQTWIQTTSGGTGDGVVTFSTDVNPGPGRTGSILIGGQTFAVTQAAAPCTYALDATNSGLLAATAGGGSVTVSAGSWCTWTATPDVAWIEAAGNGNGDGVVTFTVDSNSGPTRSGTIAIGDRTFVVTQTAASCSYVLSASGSGVLPAVATSGTVLVTTAAWCAWTATADQAWIQTSGGGTGTGMLSFSVDENPGAARSGTIVIGGEVFLVNQTESPTKELIRNGDFAGALANWTTFATPDPSYLIADLVNGVFEFARVAPPPGTGNQATIFQQTGEPIASGTPLVAQFDLGNTSSARRSVTVLLIDSDFSDLSVCTFWLMPHAPLRHYAMRTRPTEAWMNASIYFYAGTAGAGDGVYQLDNVSLQVDPAAGAVRTDCVDPTAPASTAGSVGPELLINGDFGTGDITGWLAFGQLVQQTTNGVVEFYRPTPPDPAGVLLQPTHTSLAAGEIVTAQFDLGNSSTIRKRVTVILHDLDFSDTAACTFWLAPGQPLSTYTMRSFTTRPWANATISIYAATVGASPWTRLDNVSLRRTPGAAIVGTECIEGGTNMGAAAGESSAAPQSQAAPSAPAVTPEPAVVWQAEATSTGSVALAWPAIDLRNATSGSLAFQSRLSARASTARVEVSLDGQTWQTLLIVPASPDWLTIEVDLSPFAGRVVYLRFVFDGVAAAPGDPADSWWIRAVAPLTVVNTVR